MRGSLSLGCVGLVGFVSMGLLACGDDGSAGIIRTQAPTEAIGPQGPSTIPNNTPTNTTARVRFVNATSDVPALDVYATGSATPLLYGLTYGATSAYLGLAPGAHTFEVRVAGSGYAAPPLYTTEIFSLGANTQMTAITAGLVNTLDWNDRVRVLGFPENAPYASSSALARFVNLGADAPTVSLDVGNDDPWHAEVQGIGRYAYTPDAAVALPVNQPVALGMLANGSRWTQFTAPALPIGSQLFLIAAGKMSQHPRAADGLSLLVVGPQGTLGFVRQDPAIYVLQAAQDAPQVDVFFQGYPLVNGLSYGQLSEVHQMPPSAGTTLDVLPGGYGASCGNTWNGNAGSGARVYTAPLVAGERYLVTMSGTWSGSTTQPFQAITVRDGFDLVNDGRARVRVVNAAAGSGQVDVGNAQSFASTRWASGVGFGGSTWEGGIVFDVPQTAAIGIGSSSSSWAAANYNVNLWNAQNTFLVTSGNATQGITRSTYAFAVNTSTFPWSTSTIYSR